MGGTLLDRFTDAPPAGAGLAVPASRALPRVPLVSMLCPTAAGRAEYHGGLYASFLRQSYPRRDLWVLDDSAEPSAVLTAAARKDPRVHYFYGPRAERCHDGTCMPALVASPQLSLGGARNALLTLCGGDVVGLMDDDDVYHPHYLENMVSRLVAWDADLVKLARWNERREFTGETSTYAPARGDLANLWGWGFSYVYRRFCAAVASFPETGHAEDIAFVRGLQAAGLRTRLVEDGAGWVEHLIHGWNFLRPLSL